MSSKYLSRPDIEAIWKSQNEMDSYETPDLDESAASSEVVYEVQDKENDSIDRSVLDKSAGYKAFKDKRFAGLGDDWGYGMDGLKSHKLESPLQRYQRLRFELDELAKDLEAAKQADKDGQLAKVLPDQLATEVSTMQSHMVQLLQNDAAKAVIEPDFAAWLQSKKQSDLSESLLSTLKQLQQGGAPTKATGEGVTYELFCAAPVAGEGGRDAKLGQLEAKLAALERAVGSGAAGSSISDQLTKLEGGLKLLDNSGTHMDVLRKKLDVLSTQLNIASSKQKESVTADQNAKVNEIYNTVTQWDKVAQQLPTLIGRLHALKALHMQSASFTTAVSSIEEEQQRVTKALAENSALLSQMEKSFSDNLTTVHANITELEKKMKK
jgi:hypothetical protein